MLACVRDEYLHFVWRTRKSARRSFRFVDSLGMNTDLLEDIRTGQLRLRQRDDERNADDLVVL